MRAWHAVAGLAACGTAFTGVRTVAGRPISSAQSLSAAGIGLGAAGLMVHQWLSPRSRLYGPVFWHARTPRRVMALTFDDGPCHPFTEQLLEVLDQERVRATFFLPGENVRREPELAAEVSSEHAIGNHTFTHPYLTWHGTRKIREELQRAQVEIQDATGRIPNLFRTPHGWYGPQVISTAQDLGLRCVGWSVMAWDWNRPPADTIRHRILRGSSPGGISLLHDGQDTTTFPEADRSRTIAAVPRIIESLREEGYSFVTVPDLISLDRP
ncbi:MAG TPA: polysaccharide deacetylase family protein [Rubrobacter sp.]|nr:polysaccharide deacetylase family protein [Rubrobacter sp.]